MRARNNLIIHNRPCNSQGRLNIPHTLSGSAGQERTLGKTYFRKQVVARYMHMKFCVWNGLQDSFVDHLTTNMPPARRLSCFPIFVPRPNGNNHTMVPQPKLFRTITTLEGKPFQTRPDLQTSRTPSPMLQTVATMATRLRFSD